MVQHVVVVVVAVTLLIFDGFNKNASNTLYMLSSPGQSLSVFMCN